MAREIVIIEGVEYTVLTGEDLEEKLLRDGCGTGEIACNYEELLKLNTGETV